jgi:hypothetical protein
MSYQEQLKMAIINEDFYETNEILEGIYNSDEGEGYIQFLIDFMRDNPMIDYGMPGPIVHFIEKYPQEKYKLFLLSALNEKPNCHLLWMLNRIANVADDSDKKKYTEIFRNISERNDVDEIIKNDAKGFYEFQLEN